MKESKAKLVLIGLFILAVGFINLKGLFETPGNSYSESIARQNFFGIIQNKYTDTVSKERQILVDGKKHYVDRAFYNQLNIGDSVSKKLYEFNAMIYKTDGRIIQYSLIKTKKKTIDNDPNS